MKMISPSRRGRGPIWRPALIVVAVLLVIVFLAWQRGPLEDLMWRVLAPVVGARNALGMSEVVGLRAELASTTALVADRNFLYQENMDLKARLGRTVSASSILAAVLMRPPGIPYDTLMLDAGVQQGVAIGDVVFAGGMSVIGTITGVESATSRATLFSAPGEMHQALLSRAGSTQAVPLHIEGQGSGSMKGDVPAAVRVSVGDPVTLSGIASPYVGEVSYVDEHIGGSFKTVYVHLPVDLFTLRYVEVRKPAVQSTP